MFAPFVLLMATLVSVGPQISLADGMAEMTEKQVAYPPARPVTRTYAFLVDEEVKLSVLQEALANLKTDAAASRLVQDPVRTGASPKAAFVLVEAPTSMELKSITSALRRGSKRVDRLTMTAFETEPRGFIVGVRSARDQLVGTSADVRWAESWGKSHQLYTSAGSAKVSSLASRLAKALELDKPPPVLIHTIAWKLTGVVEAEAAKRAEKSLLGLDGVKSVRIDVQSSHIEIVVGFESLDAGGPPYAISPSEFKRRFGEAPSQVTFVPRARFDTTGIFDVLDAEKLAVASQ